MDDFNFSFDDDFGPKPQKKTLNISKYIKPAIKIMILIGVILALAWFFFLRYTEVSINIIASDSSKSMPDGIVYLNDKSYNLNEPIKIVPGEYDIRLGDNDEKNYFLVDNLLNIDKEDSDLEITAYPIRFKKLSGFKANFPKEVYENQLVTIPIIINNTDNSTINISILGDNGLKDIDYDYTLKPGVNEFEVTFQNKTKKGDTLSGKLFVEYAKGINNLSTSMSLKVSAAPVLKYKNFKSSYNAPAGQNLEIILDIDNSSNINLENLNLDFDNASLDTDILKNWVVNSTTDLNIVPKGIGTAKVVLDIPLDIKPKEEYFDIIYKNSYAEVRQKLTLNIKEPEITIPKQVDFGKVTAGQTLIQKAISLENKTNHPITITALETDITTPQTKNIISDLKAIFELEDTKIIEANSTDSVVVNLIIPYTYVADNVTGNLILKSDNIDVKVPFKLEILELNIKLDIEGLRDYKYTFKPESQQSEVQNHTLNLLNSGNIDLEITSISVAQCSNVSTSIFINYPFTLKTNEKQEFLLTLGSISKSQQEQQGEKVCTINVSYKNPTTKLTEMFPKIFKIS